jgi:hypothetical protein
VLYGRREVGGDPIKCPAGTCSKEGSAETWADCERCIDPFGAAMPAIVAVAVGVLCWLGMQRYKAGRDVAALAEATANASDMSPEAIAESAAEIASHFEKNYAYRAKQLSLMLLLFDFASDILAYMEMTKECSHDDFVQCTFGVVPAEVAGVVGGSYSMTTLTLRKVNDEEVWCGLALLDIDPKATIDTYAACLADAPQCTAIYVHPSSRESFFGNSMCWDDHIGFDQSTAFDSSWKSLLTILFVTSLVKEGIKCLVFVIMVFNSEFRDSPRIAYVSRNVLAFPLSFCLGKNFLGKYFQDKKYGDPVKFLFLDVVFENGPQLYVQLRWVLMTKSQPSTAVGFSLCVTVFSVANTLYRILKKIRRSIREAQGAFSDDKPDLATAAGKQRWKRAAMATLAAQRLRGTVVASMRLGNDTGTLGGSRSFGRSQIVPLRAMDIEFEDRAAKHEEVQLLRAHHDDLHARHEKLHSQHKELHAEVELMKRQINDMASGGVYM